MSEEQLVAVGRRVRARRRELGLSLRELAAAAGVSASYVGSIEGARNPTTGRAPAPSVRILAALSRALRLDLEDLLALREERRPDGAAHEHALLYALGDDAAGTLARLIDLYDGRVDEWIYICDPRHPALPPARAGGPRVTRLVWPLGEEPYPTRMLEPERIPARLREDLGRMSGLDGRVGLVIADCSGVMRWAHNPEDEVAYEDVWPDAARAVFVDVLGRPPAANVCVYRHADLDVLAPAVDLLRVALRLIRSHEAVAVVDRDDRLATGRDAVGAMLREVRPPGVSRDAWDEVATAAAPSLAAA